MPLTERERTYCEKVVSMVKGKEEGRVVVHRGRERGRAGNLKLLV